MELRLDDHWLQRLRGEEPLTPAAIDGRYRPKSVDRVPPGDARKPPFGVLGAGASK